MFAPAPGPDTAGPRFMTGFCFSSEEASPDLRPEAENEDSPVCCVCVCVCVREREREKERGVHDELEATIVARLEGGSKEQ